MAVESACPPTGPPGSWADRMGFRVKLNAVMTTPPTASHDLPCADDLYGRLSPQVLAALAPSPAPGTPCQLGPLRAPHTRTRLLRRMLQDTDDKGGASLCPPPRSLGQQRLQPSGAARAAPRWTQTGTQTPQQGYGLPKLVGASPPAGLRTERLVLRAPHALSRSIRGRVVWFRERGWAGTRGPNQKGTCCGKQVSPLICIAGSMSRCTFSLHLQKTFLTAQDQ